MAATSAVGCRGGGGITGGVAGVARIAGVAASPTVDGLTGELSITSIGYQACALGVGGQSTAGLTFDNAPLAVGNNLKQPSTPGDRKSVV